VLKRRPWKFEEGRKWDDKARDAQSHCTFPLRDLSLQQCNTSETNESLAGTCTELDRKEKEGIHCCVALPFWLVVDEKSSIKSKMHSYMKKENSHRK